MPMEARMEPGRPGKVSGTGGFSENFVTRFHSVAVRTPKCRESLAGTSTTPTVMSAPFSTWYAIIGP